MSRIVVKVGSNVLTRSDGTPNITNMSAIVDQIAALREKGHEIVLVSSGAVACGRGAVKPHRQPDAIAARQLFSSVGQIRLINLYSQFFASYGIVAGQVLTQKDNFASRNAYLNQRACMLTMLENGVIPIVNENDTVSLTELMFTDNDELSGLVATMLDADTLVILSNVDGIYTGNPADADSQLIALVEPGKDVAAYISNVKSGMGRGGMGTKSRIASKVAAEGVEVIIARGNRPDVLWNVIENRSEVPHTLFAASERSLSTIKRWIAHSESFSKGTVTIDANACNVLTSQNAASLLPIGITAFEGEWNEGDIVTIVGPDGKKLGIGRAALSNEEMAACAGRHGQRPFIHYDYLYLF